MFERFTDRARRVVVLAQDEARALNHNYVGTEHILLGLLDEEHGLAAKTLAALDVGLDAVRDQVKEIIGVGEYSPVGHIPFTPRAKKVLELSLREALQLGDNYIGTEHILLGLIREGDGVAAQVLVRLGCDLNRVRQQVLLLQGEAKSRARVAGAAGPVAGGEAAEQILRRRAVPRERWMNEIQLALARLTERVDAIERVLGMTEPAAAGEPATAGEPAAAGEPAGAGEPGETQPGGPGEPPDDSEQAGN
jgi:ATP-dependent Clp protease ATP-binding subunit ClpC